MNIKVAILNKKKYLLVYIVLLIFFTLWFLVPNKFENITLASLLFILLLVIGVVSICYFNINNQNLHKLSFIIILSFGIISLFLSPINDISDEGEHTIRSYILSEGNLQPDYVIIPNTEYNGYEAINSVVDLANSRGINVFNTGIDDSKIDYGNNYFNSAFAQNPFYAYIAQAIGMEIAKLLDLNSIWLLWLARFCNILLYSCVIAISIKKVPI